MEWILPDYIDIGKIALIAIMDFLALYTGWLAIDIPAKWYEQRQADRGIALLKLIEDTTEKCVEDDG